MPQSMKKSPSKASDSSKDQTSLSKSRIPKMDSSGGDMDWFKGKIFLKPEDQLLLTEAELQEEIVRVLTIHNPRIPDSLVEWSWKEGAFINLPKPPDIVTILSVPGTLLHKDSEEAKKQASGGSIDAEKPTIKVEEPIKKEEEPEEDAPDAEEADEEGDDKQADGGGEAELETAEEEASEKPVKVPNQFNFCERAALTYHNPVRDMSTQTVPPPTASFNSAVFQWVIFDEYQEDYERQQREKEKEKKPLPQQKKGEDMTVKKKTLIESVAVNQRMLQAAKTLDRMVNQNIFNEILQDYRYWNDPSDEFKDGEGSLLPLWKFQYEKTKKHDVTDLCFNARYYDLFAVSFGSFSFDSPVSNGTVCLFSLKNPSYPEWTCITESPVMCLDFNTQHPHLLVIGIMDGTVAVYNVMLPPTTPQYRSNEVHQKHGGIVWEVRWAPDTDEGNLAFYSVSIDGKINHWILNQNELGLVTIMTLYLDRPPIPGPDGTLITLQGCGTCIAFHPTEKDVFLVGTEEGTIYKCNTAFSSIYMQTYNEAHNMPVYRIVFNKFNSSIFASCSGDWRIKIWEDNRLEPLFMFDLGVPIGDIQWAPYSSTVLASVSNDGKVTVFDLNVNKYRPICSQPVVSKRRSKLTRLAFNSVLPFIIVGDDKGTVNSLKLSPNLRVKVKPTKKQMHLSHEELESMKLERLLSFVREPPILTAPKDVRITN
ncbi:dynein intermediate chain 2, ciliary [Chelonus insularis]|uniref:dynein intermediate chain 2, ciliary n=1 Tax=Chelonus insularis TaxID=460826 RepID=UPI00158C5340|nr:dynein intermediate chain 2, ciliary [Chelonus insularis]